MKLMLPFFRLKSEKLYYTLKCTILFLLTSFVIPVLASSNTLPTLNQPCFIENKGQFSPQVLYVAFTPAADIWITKTSVVQNSHSNSNPPILMEICGAKTLTGKPLDILSGQMNYFYGNTQAVGVHRYGSVILKNVSDGIDMRWYFDNGQPRYDFIVMPGVNPKNAFIDFKDVKNLTVNSKGDLCFDKTDNVKQKHQGLLAYQATANGKRVVPCKFDLNKSKKNSQTVGFKVGKYDTTIPLVIDPVIMGSFFGGFGTDRINDIKLDEAGNIYVAGSTSVPGDLPSISSHYRYNNESSVGNSDGFFAKFTPDGKTLVYYNIIGGNSADEVTSLVLDKSNSVYIGGNTSSARNNGFPITSLAPDSVLGAQGEGSGFVAKFSNEGSSLEFCSYVGGEKFETISKIAYDEVNDAIFAVGTTFDSNPLPFSSTFFKGNGDAFYQAISISLRRILFSGYLGGTESDVATSLAIFNSTVVISGYTKSEDVYQSSNASRGGTDGFIAKIGKDAGQILSFRYFGSTGDDRITGVTIDSFGKTIVCGTTNSPELPIAGIPLLGSKIGESDGFVAQFSNSDSLMFCTYIGSTYDDELFDVKVDNYGQIYAIGQTKGEITTPAIPKDADYVRRFGGLGTNDCFWAMVNPKDISLNYATYLGGSNADFARGIAIYKDHIYCAGFTSSADFQPIGGTGFTPNHKGASDGFFCSQDLPIHSPNIYPSSIDFGKVFINTIVKRDSIVIKNVTSRPIRFTKTSQDYNPFALRHPLDSFTLNPLEQTVVYAYFAPDTKGTFGSIFDIQYETGPPFEVKVSGEGIAPSITMTPKELDFGLLEMDTSKTRKLLIVNKGTASGYIRFNKFNDKSLFKYKDDLIPNDTILNVGESVEVSIVFTASIEGSYTEDFIVKSDETELYSKLSAEAIAPHFAWDKANLFFGNVRLGRDISMPLAIKNTGKARGKINSFQLINNKEYALYVLDLPEDSIVHPGDIVQCAITFTPSLRSSATDSLFTATQAGDLILPLFGYGVYPSMEQQSKEVLKYGNISVGASNFQTIKLRNVGNDVDTLYSTRLATISGEVNFELVSNLVPGSILSPESPIEFTVIFNPKSPGIKTDTAFITCGTKTFKTVLIGEGITSKFVLKVYKEDSKELIDIKDSTIRWGGTLVGSTSQNKTYIINNGSDTGFVGQIVISPSTKKNFNIDPSTKQNFRLGPNDSSLITINFSPDSIGLSTGAILQIYDSSEIVLTAKLRGEATGASFSTYKKYVEFDSTYVETKSDSLFFFIKNEGNIQKSPTITVLKDDEKSFVQLTTPKVIGHNDSIKVFYQFTPHSPGKKFATLQVGGSNGKEPYTVQLYGYALATSTKAELSFGDTILAKIGQKISLPLIVRNIDGIKMDSVHSIRCVLRYNSTVLGVDYQLRDSLIVNNDLAILSLQRTTSKVKKGDTVLNLEFTVGLGNSPVTDIIVEKFEWKNEKDSPIEISTSLPHSKVRVTDIAEINGNLRLYDKGHSAEMTLSANTLPKTPLTIHIDGGLHCSSLVVYDERGRVVSDLSFVLKSDVLEFDFDTSTLSMGMYYCVLSAGNTIIVKDFVVQ